MTMCLSLKVADDNMFLSQVLKKVRLCHEGVKEQLKFQLFFA